jgi:hypothetical protein
MKVQQILTNPSLLQQLNEKISRHTNFKDLTDLIDPARNFRLTLYFDDSMNNLQKMEIKEVANFYDEYMELHDDPRRIYRIGE